MTETVTDIIVARSRQSDGLQTMMLWSTAGHIALVAALLLTGGRVIEDPREPVMTISLGGAPGPKTGGLTQAGARAVQEQAPPDAPPKPVLTPLPLVNMLMMHGGNPSDWSGKREVQCRGR